jgi:hypothetical protein
LTTLERKIDYLEGKTRVSQDIEAEEEALAQQQQGHETAEMMPPPPPPPMIN